MAKDNPTPTRNFLSQVGFQFAVDRIPGVVYHCQAIKMPGVTLPEATSNMPFGQIPYGGDQIKWEPLEVTFKVDEDIKNYQEIFNWLTAIGHPKDFAALKSMAPTGRVKDMMSDGILQILSSHKNSIKQIQFIGLVPISLEGLSFDTTGTDITFLDATVQFRYQRWEFLA